MKIPDSIKFFNPHPYLLLGAPYKDVNFLWKLREGVVNRLIQANEYLRKISDYNLIIYDTWRPIEVQTYMFYLSCKEECKKKGIKYSRQSINSYPEIIDTVEKFWAYPSFDEKAPPPHSTGAAIDITLGDSSGNLLNMGSSIDEMNKTSLPDFFKKKDNKNAFIWNKRRDLLRDVMFKLDFVQHPNEWWHFSYGDQLWAWKNKKANALYGKI